jgi:hypothetical protein
MIDSSLPPKASSQRVLVAVDAASGSDLAVEAAVGLAAALDEVRLEGLVVEDADLVRLGGLPFASEVSALTGGSRSLAAAEIEYALRVEAARLERLFAQAAQRARLPWSFAIARGQLLGEAFARAADLTVVAPTARSRGATALGALAPARPRQVAAVLEESKVSWRTLAVAAQLAKTAKAELLLLMLPDDPERQALFGARARSWLSGQRLAASIATLASGVDALAGALRLRRADTLVHPAPRDAVSARALGALVAELPCLLVVVRGGEGEHPAEREVDHKP